MICSGSLGMTVTDQKNYQRKEPVKIRPLNGENSLFMAFWGKKWEDEKMDQAVEIHKSGHHPWFCQKCANRICPVCGGNLLNPMCSDSIHDDGTTSHCSILPVPQYCENPQCSRHPKSKVEVKE
ncbi:hypothetical protein Dalk_4803 [Desulfatibacillum aliphaticivorans]|uniref:Uncharacterized protein n=2 Tax=Desulfatibacillum aliphaticivorans TaxID=218208 RepID=B8FD49_DESAL|nr:hypothetical protein Dalk_4803 [Desulfatibacillum aliphaticivorans]